MRRALAATALIITGSGALAGQSPRGLYRPDPTHFVCNQCSLAQLIMAAFGIRDYQLSGPAFLEKQLVDARVDVPPGATQEQYQQILRNLLETRVGLVAHRETRSVPGFELVVAEGGPQLQSAGSDVAAADPFGIMPRQDAGTDVASAGGRVPTSSLEVSGGMVSIRGHNAGIAVLARMLSNQLRQPVRDSTGLTGRYSFALSWAQDSTRLEKELEKQTGLKLQPASGAVEMVVVDHIERRVK